MAGANGVPTCRPTRLKTPRLKGLAIALPFSIRLKYEPHKFVNAIGITGTSSPSRLALSKIFMMPPLKGCNSPSLVMPPSGKIASKYQGASGQLEKSMQQLYAARDDMQRDVVDLEATRSKLWDAMQKLNGAIHFAETLDARLHAKVETLKTTDAVRAKALEQEVLFYARQNLQDMLTQQAVCTNGYLALDVLKKTGREMMNGCNRVATTGMSALAVAQTVARATGNQIKVMEMLSGVNSTIEGLISETGRQLNTHVDKTAQFAQNPIIGIEKLKEMFDQTFKAMDAMDTFRSKAIDVMGQNNEIIKQQLAKADQYVDRNRQQQAREATRLTTSGPVAL